MRLIAIAAAVCLALVGFFATRGGDGQDVSAQVKAKIAIADERIAAGQLVRPGGDDALEHLIAARQLDPGNAAVRERLRGIANTYQDLATQAVAVGSFAEAATHLQVVLSAEPDNVAAAAQLQTVEAKMLERQRQPPR